MKKYLPTICLVLALLAGSAIMIYPSASNYWNSFHQSKAIAGYVQSVAQADVAQCERMLKQAQDYNEKIKACGTGFSVFGEAYREYMDTLDINGSGIMGYIEIGRIDCNLPIYHGTDESVLQVAVGHIAGTSLPVGGEGTHCVLSGHRGLPSAKIFSDLNRLSEGDTFVIHTLGETLTYEVDAVQTVTPSETGPLAAVEGKDLCTLVTCTPYGVNTHRLLVRGHRIENESSSEVRVCSEAMVLERSIAAPFFAAPLAAAGFMWFAISTKIRAKQTISRKKAGLVNMQ